MEAALTPRIVILGVGNLLMSDDGVGVHAAQALAAAPPPGTTVVDAGTDVLSALSFLEQADRALIIDALRAGGAPGTIRLMRETDITALAAGATAHAVNLLAARHLFPREAAWPDVSILGVEPDSLDYGTALSPAVAAALPLVAHRCRAIVASWQTSVPVTFQEDLSA